MRSVEALRKDHELIRRTLSCLERAAEEVQSGGRVEEDVFRKAFDFARGFVHGPHQIREEILSRHAMKSGLDGGGTEVCSDILDFLGAALRALPEALQGEPTARRLLSENAKAYVGLVRSHIVSREELFEAAESIFSEEDERTLSSLFRAAESTRRGSPSSAR